MPILHNKYNYVKIYRPSGTRYAKGSSDDKLLIGVIDAIEDAIDNFTVEFGRAPDNDTCVIEVVCTSVTTAATIFEIPDEDT